MALNHHFQKADALCSLEKLFKPLPGFEVIPFIRFRRPIVRLIVFGASIDIAVNSGGDLQSVIWVKKQLIKFPPTKNLVYVLKAMLFELGFLNTRHGLSSFTLTTLIIAFFEVKPSVSNQICLTCTNSWLCIDTGFNITFARNMRAACCVLSMDCGVPFCHLYPHARPSQWHLSPTAFGP